MRRARGFGFLCIVLQMAKLPGQPVAGQSEAVLTTVRQVRSLTPEQAGLGYPVRIRGVVTWFKPETREFFFQDATAGIYIHRGDPDPGEFRMGQELAIEGVTGPGPFARVVTARRVRVLGRAELPMPLPVHFEQLAGGVQDGQWVEIAGIVQSVERGSLYGGERMSLKIDIGGGAIRASLSESPQADPGRLVDARVRVRGVCASFFNKRGQFLGPRVRVTSLSDIQVDEPAPSDTWTIQELPIKDVLRFHPRRYPGHRSKVRGIVTYQSAAGFYIQNGDQGIWVQTTEPGRVEPGAVVEAVGFAAPGGYSPVLNDALFRRLADGPPPSPPLVTASQVLGGSYDSLLIGLDATVLEQVRRLNDWVFVLQQGDSVFNAYLSTDPYPGLASQDSAQPEKLAPGTKVRLTGVSSVEVDAGRHPESFRLLLRTPSDVVVLKHPAWLTETRALWGLALMGIASVGAFFWATALRRRIRRQTDLIREKLKRESAWQERYHDLLENASDMVYSRDIEGRFLMINRAGEHITGFTRDEILRMTIDDLVQPEQREYAKKVNEQLLAGNATLSVEFDLRTKGGRRITIEVSPRVIYEDGKPVRIDGIARDVTVRKLARLELERAKEAADRASAAKSEFLANMSHEVRTPMNGIMGMTSLLLDTPLDSEQRNWLEAVKMSSESLLNLLNDILDFSKIEANKLVIESAPLNLKATLESVVQLMRPAAEKKGLRVWLDYGAGVPCQIAGDEARIRQIVLNYVVNAVKFTAQGEICVRVTASEVLDSGTGLRIAVRDSGIGIPCERQPELFQKFSQADGSTTRKYGGTGLGLAISKQLAQLMGGAVGVTSEPGQGSIFWVELPLNLPAGNEGTPSGAEQPGHGAEHDANLELIAR